MTDVLTYRSDILGNLVVIPAGFTTDFSSVPRLGLSYSLFGDTGHAAAAVHDFACRFGWVKTITGVKLTVDRDKADRVFYEALKAEGVSAWRRPFMYAGVRAGSYWRKLKDLF